MVTGNLGQGMEDPIQPGQYAEMVVTFDQSHLDEFASLVGDFNPLHTSSSAAVAFAGDNDVAAAAWNTNNNDQRVVVHGMLVASLLDAIWVARMPGTVLRDQSLKFLRPVRVGDTVTGRIEVKTITELGTDHQTKARHRRIGKVRAVIAVHCDTTVRNTNDEEIIYLRGKAIVWVPIV
jgi:acyl dehydratase